MSDKVYQQSGDYIPRTDAGLKAFLINFSNLISQDPGKFGLSEQDAEIIQGLSDQFSNLFDLCQSPATRTTGLVTQKDAIRASAKGTVRVYAQQIKANKGVDNQAKIELGLHLDDPTKTPIPAPDSAPLLSIVAAFSGEHIIRYRDENTPDTKAKPAGARQIQIYRHVAPGAVTLPDGAVEVGLYPRQPVKVMCSQEDVGKTATYFGRWVNGKGEVGPWSLPVCMTIAFGGPVDQQMWIPSSPDGGQTAGGEDDLKIAA